MPGINRVPFGLLGFTGLKSLGANPDTLLQSVQPVADMMQFWASGQPEVVAAGPVAPASLGAVVPSGGVVPAGEAWLITSLCARTVVGAGDTVVCRAAIFPPNFFIPTYCENFTQSAAVAGIESVCTLSFVTPRSPILLGAGWQLGAYFPTGVLTGTSALTVVFSVFKFTA